METGQNVRNNSRCSNFQSTSGTSLADSSKCTNEVYICIPKIQSIGPLIKPLQSYHNLKKSGSASSNNIRFKPTSELIAKHIYYANSGEEPIDLTCAEKRDEKQSTTIENFPPTHVESELESDTNNMELNHSELQKFQNNLVINGTSVVRRRGRKRKYAMQNRQIIEEFPTPSFESGDMLKTLDNSDLFQITNNRQAEVLKAAKSLFSKRTRTLFHWIYPNTPKAQLKAAVAASWETLGDQEKDFYISQVLGRFGFPQTNLMVNPQLGGLPGILSISPLNLTTANSGGNEETSNAVSNLLLSENGNASGGSWMHAGTSTQRTNASAILPNRSPYSRRVNRKKRRLGKPLGSKNRKSVKEEFPILKQIRDDATPEEFQDDPELNREFQQFRWTLHINDNNKP